MEKESALSGVVSPTTFTTTFCVSPLARPNVGVPLAVTESEPAWADVPTDTAIAKMTKGDSKARRIQVSW
jgi:hypothetical protein